MSLEKPNNPYYKQHYYLLENIVRVQCIALVNELRDRDGLATRIFELFYRIIGKNKSVDLDYLLTSILTQLVQEFEILPSRIVDIIISHFLSKPPESTQKDNHSLPVSAGYNLSKAICTENIDVMTRHVNQYFSDIMSVSANEDYEEEMERGSRKPESTMKSAHIKAQELAVEIWTAVPELLVTIIGQLEQDLTIDDLQVRELATVSIGRMLGHSPSRINFVKEHFTTWKAWLGRIKDKNYQIRVAWTNALPNIIKNRTDIISEITIAFTDRLNDLDERVRLASCSVFSQLKINVIAAKLNNRPLFNALFSRLRDTKPLVRQEAFLAVGSLFENAYPQIDMGDEKYIKLFGPIPQKIIYQLYVNDKDVSERIDIALNENIFVIETDDNARTQRFLTVLGSLGEEKEKAFNAILNRQHTVANYVRILARVSKDYKDNKEDSAQNKTRIDSIIKWLASSFAESNKAEANLNYFVSKANDRSLKLLANTVNPENDYATVQKSIKELLAEIKRLKPTNLASVLHTFTILIYRSSYLIVNRSNIAPMLQVIKDPSHKHHHTAQQFLKNISATQPALMKSHMTDLVTIIETGKPGFDGSVETLEAANSLAEKFRDLIPQTFSFFSAVVKMVLEGSPQEATQAVKLIFFADEKNIYFNEIISAVTNLDLENPKLPTFLAAIAELYVCAPDLIEPKHQSIQTFLTQKVLLSNAVIATSDDPEWVDDNKIDTHCQSKLLALHILVKRLKQISDPEVVKQLSKPVFALLASLIGNMGEIVRQSAGLTPLHYKARLRLESGLLFLELATSSNIERLIRPNEIIKMAQLVQDGVLQVRQRFLHTLMDYWTKQKISRRFGALIFIDAFEPENELLQFVSTWIRSRVASEDKSEAKTMSIEKTFSNLLHLLVHHQESFEEPEGGLSDKQLQELERKSTLDYVLKTATYISFYLGTVATEENVSMLFYISQRVKQYRDNVDEDLSDRLYLVSDLAQFIIIKYQEFRGWNVDTWPGRLQLSADIFKPMPSVQVAQKVAKTMYLPTYVLTEVQDILRRRFRKYRKQQLTEINDDEQNDIADHETGEAGAKGSSKNNGDGAVSKRKRAAPGSRKREDEEYSTTKSAKTHTDKSSSRRKRQAEDLSEIEDDVDEKGTRKRSHDGEHSVKKRTHKKIKDTIVDESSRRRSSRVTGRKSLKEVSENEEEEEEEEDNDQQSEENEEQEENEEIKSPTPPPKPMKKTVPTRTRRHQAPTRKKVEAVADISSNTENVAHSEPGVVVVAEDDDESMETRRPTRLRRSTRTRK